MPTFSYYANITLLGPSQADVAALLKQVGVIAYVAPTVRAATIVFHSDLGGQEILAADLSSHFKCPALLAMAFGEGVFLYQLYVNGDRTDAYVSKPHEDLELDEPPGEGNAELLCEIFNVDRRATTVRHLLDRPTTPANPATLAVNRHGELFRALGLPTFAAGTGFEAIEMGEAVSHEGPTAVLADCIKT